MKARCLVTGGTGFVGSHLVEALLERGAEVRCLVRSSTRLRWLEGLPVEVIEGDLSGSRLQEAVTGADYVFNVGGLTKARTDAEFHQANGEGVARLLEACRASRQAFQRIVLVSTQAVAGPTRRGQSVTEDQPLRPVTPYGHSKAHAEMIAWRYHSDLPLTILRPAVVYGPRDAENLPLYRSVARGLMPLPGGDKLLSMVHVRDLAAALILAAESESAAGRTYFVADDEPYSLLQIFRLIAASLGQRALPLSIPAPLVHAGALLSELHGRWRGETRVFERKKVPELVAPGWVCSNQRARRELEFAPRVSIAGGIRETASWYRDAGWL